MIRLFLAFMFRTLSIQIVLVMVMINGDGKKDFLYELYENIEREKTGDFRKICQQGVFFSSEKGDICNKSICWFTSTENILRKDFSNTSEAFDFEGPPSDEHDFHDNI